MNIWANNLKTSKRAIARVALFAIILTLQSDARYA